MPKTVEAVVDDEGRIRLLEAVPMRARQRVLVTLLDEESPTEGSSSAQADDTALLSEEALAKDWTRDEEDQAWKHLQPDQ